MSNFNNMYSKIKDGAMNGLKKGGARLERSIKVNIRKQNLIDKGRLVNSPSSVIEDNGNTLHLKAGTNVEYAVFHEYGTSKFPAKPFIRPAFNENEKIITKDVLSEIKKSIKF